MRGQMGMGSLEKEKVQQLCQPGPFISFPSEDLQWRNKSKQEKEARGHPGWDQQFSGTARIDDFVVRLLYTTFPEEKRVWTCNYSIMVAFLLQEMI